MHATNNSCLLCYTHHRLAGCHKVPPADCPGTSRRLFPTKHTTLDSTRIKAKPQRDAIQVNTSCCHHGNNVQHRSSPRNQVEHQTALLCKHASIAAALCLKAAQLDMTSTYYVHTNTCTFHYLPFNYTTNKASLAGCCRGAHYVYGRGSGSACKQQVLVGTRVVHAR